MTVAHFHFDAELRKVSEDKRLVSGWAYVSEKSGTQVVDHSGEFVSEAEEVEKAAHAFVRDSRRGGEMHEQTAGEIVDSIFFSKEIQDALGIDLGKVGWFITMKVHDDGTWAKVKSGELTMFSIAGASDFEEVA